MEGEDGDTGNARAFTRQGFWKKFVIFAAGAFMNFLTGLLIVAILFSSAGTFFVDGDHRPCPGGCPGPGKTACRPETRSISING